MFPGMLFAVLSRDPDDLRLSEEIDLRSVALAPSQPAVSMPDRMRGLSVLQVVQGGGDLPAVGSLRQIPHIARLFPRVGLFAT